MLRLSALLLVPLLILKHALGRPKVPPALGRIAPSRYPVLKRACLLPLAVLHPQVLTCLLLLLLLASTAACRGFRWRRRGTVAIAPDAALR